MNTILTNLFAQIVLGEPQQYKNVVEIPLFHAGNHSPEYLTLLEGLQNGQVTILEKGGGSVPAIVVTNQGDLPVLLVVGEELKGAKQNRALNITLFVAAKSELEVPVSCTEAGRWREVSHAFLDAGYISPHKLRVRTSDSVTASLAMKLGFKSDQQAVWGQVQDLSSIHSTKSPTRAMSDVMAAKSKDLANYLDALRPMPDQKGLMVFVDGVVLGMDMLSSARAYHALHPKFIQSYALDALLHPAEVKVEEPQTKARGFLERCQASEEEVHKSVGMGQDFRLHGKGVRGTALVHEDNVLHVNFYRN